MGQQQKHQSSIMRRLIPSGIKTLLLLIFMAPKPVIAGSTDGSSNPTFYLDVTTGISSTYKSKMVDSNDTGSNIMYAIGGHAGANHNLGFVIKTQTDTTNFVLNQSKINASWQDAIVRYGFGPFYFGISFSHLELKSTSAGTQELDAAGSGYGENVGLNAPMGRSGSIYLDITSASVSKEWNNIATTPFKGATHTDIDLGISYYIYKDHFALLAGYKQRSGIITTTKANSEQLNVTYLGLRSALNF